MSKDLTGKDLKQNLSQAKKDAAEIAKSSKQIEDALSKAAKAISGMFKGGNRFVANTPSSGGGGFGGRGGGGGGSMPGPGDMQNNSLFTPGVGLSDFTNFASGMAKGLGNFLPDVGSTVQRAGNYYNATIMGGYRGSQRISRSEVDDRTYGVLNSMGGITSAGSSAMVANIFANQGMVATSSTYMQNTRAVGNAARYLNMSNEKAAVAIGGLGTGASSANIMRNFGIYTTDPNTGKERTMSQVFEDLAFRLQRPGTTATAEDVQNSIRKGALGAAIASSGLSEDQQTLFKQYMIDRAGGNKMDLSNQDEMNKIMGKAKDIGNSNPLNAFMDLEGSSEGAQKSAESSYLFGIQGATMALKGLDLVAGKLATVLGAVTAGLQVTLGGNTVQGLLGMANSSVNLFSSGLDAVMSADPTGASRAIAGGAAMGVATKGLEATAIIAASGVTAGAFGQNGGSGVKKYGGSGAGEAAMGSDTGDFSNRLGGLDKGGYSLGADSSMTFTPVIGSAGTPTLKFNEQRPSELGAGPHKGIDYSAPSGTEVFAVADGEIVKKVDGLEDAVVNSSGVPAYSGSSFGNHVKIDHGRGKNGKNIFSIYAHLKKGSIPSNIKEGAKVKSGAFIGKVGSSGNSQGAHLHYEVREGNKPIDPKTLQSLLKVANGADATKYGVSSSQATQAQAMTDALTSLYSGDVNTAISKLTSSLGIDSMSSNYGLSSTSAPANKYANAGDTGAVGGGGSGGVVNNVGGITVNIKDSSPESAKKFAEYVRDYLANQTLTSNLGRF